ncbi:MAG: ABC transporter permease [Nitrospirae bacterium]|nr:ABC transporter permease [Nitrospirota bacterium]
MAIMVIAVAFGTALAASLLTVSFEISNRVAVELRAFGANISVEPKVEGMAGLAGQTRWLNESDLKKIKTVFWRHNILGFSPVLEAENEVEAAGRRERVTIAGTWHEKKLQLPGEERKFSAGAVSVSPWWDVQGAWPPDDSSVAVGSALAARLGVSTGNAITVSGRRFTVSGILTTGGREDEQVVMELSALQSLAGLQGKISRVLVSALSTPMDDFAYKNPDKMSRAEYEKWYCTAYVTSIAKQVEEVMTGSRARPVWQVAETEGKVLDRLRTAIYLLCAVALAASSIGVATTMITSLLRRVEEIGLMKAMGADSFGIARLFLSEAVIIGLAGGLVGLLASVWISGEIGLRVFGTKLAQRTMLFPLSVTIALVISVTGSLFPIARALRIKPAVVLKGAE